MKVRCPACRHEFEADEALKNQLDTQMEAQREKFKREYLALKEQLEKAKSDAEREAQQKIRDAENRAKEQVKAEADKAARTLYEGKIDGLNKETAELLRQLTDAKLAQSEADKLAQKKILEETERIYRAAKEKSDEENRLKLEEKELQLKQTGEALRQATEKAERGSQQIQGEALEQLVERELKEECRFDEVESVKTGIRGADIRHSVINGRGERAGVILWEIKNAKWQEAWIEKFKADIAAEKAAVGVIVVVDLPERFGELACVSERVFAIRPRMVRPLALLLRQKILELYEIGQSQKFSSENIEAFYNYLTGGEFQARLISITETYRHLHDLHEKDKKATYRRWGEYEKQLQKMQLNSELFIGELRGLSNGEIAGIDEPELLGAGGGEEPEE